MSASNYLRAATLNHFLRGIQQPSPPNVYLALYISNPTIANTGTEVAGGAYKRVRITYDEPVIETRIESGASVTVSVIYNNNLVEFPIATSDWGKVTHWGVCDSENGGNLLDFDAFIVAQDILQGNQAVFNTATNSILCR